MIRFMNTEIKNDFDALLDKHDENVKQDGIKESEKKSVQDVFGSEFERITNEIIRPAMVELGESMKSRGHTYDITTGKEEIDPRMNFYRKYNSISMPVRPSGIAPNLFDRGDTPYIRFSGNKESKKVEIYESTMRPLHGGSAGAGPSVEIGQITYDYVQRAIVNWLKKVLDLQRFHY